MSSAQQAIILAAGRGSRMGELTADQPKCLTSLMGRRLLDWQRAALDAAGIPGLTVITGYRKELLSATEYATLENSHWADTNMVATLCCATKLLRSTPCVISYSDIVYHPSHVRALATAQADISIAYDTLWESLWSARFESPLEDAETFRQENGWLKTIGERASNISDIQGQYMGLLKFTPKGWEQAEAFLSALADDERKRIDMTSLLRGLLREGASIRCVPVQGAWCEVDSGSDVQLYERLLNSNIPDGNHWDHDWRW